MRIRGKFIALKIPVCWSRMASSGWVKWVVGTIRHQEFGRLFLTLQSTLEFGFTSISKL